MTLFFIRCYITIPALSLIKSANVISILTEVSELNLFNSMSASNLTLTHFVPLKLNYLVIDS